MRRSPLPDNLSLRHPDKQAIINDLDPDIVRRMRNWVDWRGGGVASGTSSWVIDYGCHLDRYREARMPILVAEAERTNAAILAIPDQLGQAVALFWLGGEDASFVEMGMALGCTDKTCKARILRGHTNLTAEFYRRQAHLTLPTSEV